MFKNIEIKEMPSPYCSCSSRSERLAAAWASRTLATFALRKLLALLVGQPDGVAAGESMGLGRSDLGYLACGSLSGRASIRLAFSVYSVFSVVKNFAAARMLRELIFRGSHNIALAFISKSVV